MACIFSETVIVLCISGWLQFIRQSAEGMSVETVARKGVCSPYYLDNLYWHVTQAVFLYHVNECHELLFSYQQTYSFPLCQGHLLM